MSGQHQISLDQQAADLAEAMFKGGAAGDMPARRRAAEGGFTDDAGGQVIDADADGNVNKALKMNGEPGAQNPQRKTGANMNSEPKGTSGSGQPGEGGNLSQSGDEEIRARKPGQVGVSGGSTGGGNLSENEDDTIRQNKSGKVGMSKSQMVELGMSQSQMELAAQMGLVKGMEIEIEEDDEEDEDEAEKGLLTPDGLNKSLDALESIALGSVIGAPRERRAELAEKLADGTLNKSERAELGQLMKAGDVDDVETDWEEDFAKSWQEEFSADPANAEAYDASAFLERQSQLIAAALDQTQDTLRKAFNAERGRSQTFNVALAKSLRGMAHLTQGQGELIKSLSERLGVVEQTPLPRRGVSNLRALNKSMPGEAGGGSEIGRKQILDTLEAMSHRRGTSQSGERLDYAVTLYEQTGDISKSLYREVVEELRKSGNGVGIQ